MVTPSWYMWFHSSDNDNVNDNDNDNEHILFDHNIQIYNSVETKL